MNMPHIGFCGNDTPHDEHFVQYMEDMPHWGFICRGVDEEGNAITEERTPINDCAE